MCTYVHIIYIHYLFRTLSYLHAVLKKMYNAVLGFPPACVLSSLCDEKCKCFANYMNIDSFAQKFLVSDKTEETFVSDFM